MEKKFYRYALYGIIGSACLSVLGSILLLIAYKHDQAGTSLYNFLNYMKIAFDLVALFVGLGTIIFGFARFGTKGGLKSMLLFCSSYVISVIWFVIGMIIDTGFSMMSLMVNIYYSIGYNFMTLLLPAIIVGIISYYTTRTNSKDPDKFISLSNPVNRAILFSTIAVFALNFVSLYIISVFPFLIDEGFYIFFSDFLSMIVYPTIETIVEYLVVQYVMYIIIYATYKKYMVEMPPRHQHNRK